MKIINKRAIQIIFLYLFVSSLFGIHYLYKGGADGAMILRWSFFPLIYLFLTIKLNFVLRHRQLVYIVIAYLLIMFVNGMISQYPRSIQVSASNLIDLIIVVYLVISLFHYSRLAKYFQLSRSPLVLNFTVKKGLILGILSAITISTLLVLNERFGDLCNYWPDSGYPIKYCEVTAYSLTPLLILIPFSVLSFSFNHHVFRAWWEVAVWMLPIIMFFTFLFHHSGGGGSGVRGAYGDAFAMLVIGLLYAIFIITALVRIFLAYRRSS